MTKNEHQEAVAVFKRAHYEQYPKSHDRPRFEAAKVLCAAIVAAAKAAGLEVDSPKETEASISLGHAKVRLRIEGVGEHDPYLLLRDGGGQPLPITYDAGVDAYLGPESTDTKGQTERRDAVTACAEAIAKILRAK